MKQNLMFVENENGRQFAVKLLSRGDRYGLEKCLEWDSDKMGVEFYDVKYAGDGFDELGQFVSRYYAETLVGTPTHADFSLAGGVAAWTIDRNNAIRIKAWVASKLKGD